MSGKPAIPLHAVHAPDTFKVCEATYNAGGAFLEFGDVDKIPLKDGAELNLIVDEYGFFILAKTHEPEGE